MAHDKSPLRLIDDPNTIGPLRALIEGARSDLPEPSRLQAFAEKLDATLTTQSAPTDVPMDTAIARPDLGNALTWGKLSLIGLGLVLGGAIVSVIGFGGRDNEPNLAARSTATSSAAAHTTSFDQTGTNDRKRPPIIPSAAPPRPPMSVTTTPQTSTPQASNGTDAKARAPDPTPLATNEATLLLEARSALSRDAARALRITQEHARRFPAGVLAQEREVIAIEALRRLGRTDLAQKRSVEFDKRYPGSVHRSKIKQALENP